MTDRGVLLETRLAPRPVEPATSRLAEVVVSLVLPAPVVLTILAVVKVSSPGPAVFKHSRVGLNRPIFKVLKFRTMDVGTDNEVMSDLVQRRAYGANGFRLRADDTRITKTGPRLRESSLDELLRVVNVLFGHMNLVRVYPVRDVELAFAHSTTKSCTSR